MHKKLIILSILGIVIMLMASLYQKQEPIKIHDTMVCQTIIQEQDKIPKVQGKESINVQEYHKKDSEDILLSKTESLNAQEPRKIILPNRSSSPETYGYLTKEINVFSEEILSGYYLNYNINAAIAANSVKDYIIQPGEVFSFNEAIGPRTKEKGYVEGVSISGDHYIVELAGGICRTSTALYNSALAAELPIIESHRHTMPVYYADTGRDAAVYYDQLDMKFKNNQDLPVKILVHISNGRIYVALQEVQPDYSWIVMDDILADQG